MKLLFIVVAFIFTQNSWSEERDLKKFFDEMISEQQQEVKELQRMRDEFMTKKVPGFEQELVNLQRELNQDFRKFAAKLRGENYSETPKVELKEGPMAYDVKVEVPGMDDEDVKVSVVDNDLVISGVREKEEKSDNKRASTTEFSYGEYRRTIRLNEKVDPKSLDVKFGDGIVNIHLNKMSKTRS